MTINQEIIDAGNLAVNNPLNTPEEKKIQTVKFEEFEIKHRKKVPDYVHLAQEPIVADQRYCWSLKEIGRSFSVSSLWAVVDLTKNPTFEGHCRVFRLNSFTSQKDISFTVKLKASNLDKNYGSVAVWSIPTNVLYGATELELVCNMDILRMSLFGKASNCSVILGHDTKEFVDKKYWD